MCGDAENRYNSLIPAWKQAAVVSRYLSALNNFLALAFVVLQLIQAFAICLRIVRQPISIIILLTIAIVLLFYNNRDLFIQRGGNIRPPEDV